MVFLIMENKYEIDNHSATAIQNGFFKATGNYINGRGIRAMYKILYDRDLSLKDYEKAVDWFIEKNISKYARNDASFHILKGYLMKKGNNNLNNFTSETPPDLTGCEFDVDYS